VHGGNQGVTADEIHLHGQDAEEHVAVVVFRGHEEVLGIELDASSDYILA
jgi:hypothetical protein